MDVTMHGSAFSRGDMMLHGKTIALLLPARNEAEALPAVLEAVPDVVDQVLVLDNGSTDATSRVAYTYGAHVVYEPVKGYGSACLAGLLSLAENSPDIVAFADADGSDDLSSLCRILEPLACQRADLVLGMRVPGEASVFSIQQRFGNWLSTRLLRLVWGHTYRDLGPMRAITWSSLQRLNMRDRNYGWTVEMQIKALKVKLRIEEVPVRYRRRAGGSSKVSRSLTGSVRAGAKILWVIGREALSG